MVNYITGVRALDIGGDTNAILGTGSTYPGRRVRDVHDEISLLDSNQSALVTLLMKLRRKKSQDVKFEWFEDEFPSRRTTITPHASSTDTVIGTAAGGGTLARVGDLWMFGSTGEMVYVTVVNSSTSITVIRGVGGTQVQQAATGDDFYYVGNAQQTGADSRAALTTQTVGKENYCQLLKEAFEITNTANATKLYGGPERAYLRRKHGIIHQRDKEVMFWFGVNDHLNAADDSLTTSAYLSKGVLGPGGANGWIETNTQTSNASAYTEDEFDMDLITLFRYGNSTKFAFCSPMAMSVLSSFGRDKLQMVPRDTTYGINITRYISPHGELNLINNKLFQDMEEGSVDDVIDVSKLIVILDLENLYYRYLRDTQLEMNIEDPDEDKSKDQFLSEVGLELQQEKTHGYITDVQYS